MVVCVRLDCGWFYGCYWDWLLSGYFDVFVGVDDCVCSVSLLL